MRTIKDADIKNKIVLVRVDFNVTVEDGRVAEDFRIRAVLPTISYVLLHGARKILLISHFGRPDGKRNGEYSLAPITKHVSNLLGKDVAFIDDGVKEGTRARIEGMKEEIFLLENLRFHKGEEENSEAFARSLAELADIFVQDAFGVLHRTHASTVALPKILPSYAGLLLEREVDTLTSLLKNPKRPFTALMGGAKISTKIPVIQKFLEIADNVCLGGALANTALKAKGMAVGKSLIEEEMVQTIKNIELTDTRLHLPVDVKVAKDKQAAGGVEIKGVGNVGDDELILDIGPDTQALFGEIVKKSRTALWNGPMGYIENAKFQEGTERIAKDIADASAHAFTVVGGGDTYLTLERLGIMEKVGFVSTGGGAMLDFLAKGTLPGIEALTL